MRYFKKLSGKKVYLSPVNIDDAEKYAEWLNDMDVTVNLTLSNMIISTALERDLLVRLSTSHDSFAIVSKDTDKLIGNCGFLNVDQLNRKAEVGIFIGDRNYWNKGYGTEALTLLLDFGFNVRNFNNIFLTVKDFNARAIKCYEKLGFKVIGRRREASIFGDRKYDDIFMDMLPDEFRGNSFVKSILEKIDGERQ
ncbi:MAG: GNAT family N-acetyltransferase [Candidatus Wallbacteria bacterium HGW-Wallbacteria-1]|jgi:RimJ/RimL family protein N-acetyltransferase|uniref:GNAT family N-acetyltransferase n=1 Tax=Candidatus Wallbacteria bacterium HGW-Wallbacteria-1 TaxID=2013854 RepID=A0A2N1PN47_9BACT|nr:MAG: GNAT family N-acetyltransferase [Candidatus Wallbacteria bacterium HGW-Wallbacteria-1]